jgi:hypothetical protein
MDWLQATDFLVPTNPYAALFFGVMFTLVVSIVVWTETKEKKTVLIAFISGCLVSLAGVTFLHVVGFY